MAKVPFPPKPPDMIPNPEIISAHVMCIVVGHLLLCFELRYLALTMISQSALIAVVEDGKFAEEHTTHGGKLPKEKIGVMLGFSLMSAFTAWMQLSLY
jgi:hypothetical protein